MAKYRKKPIVVEAEQWSPGKQIEGVRTPFGTTKANVIWSRDRRFYYVQLSGIWPEHWLGVEKHAGPVPDEKKNTGYLTPSWAQINRKDTDEVYHREVLDFHVWDLKSAKDENGRTLVEERDPDDDLVQEYVCTARPVPGEKQKAYIDTPEGRMEVSAGDWVITGVKGEKYPCKPDIFEATYELVEDGEAQS